MNIYGYLQLSQEEKENGKQRQWLESYLEDNKIDYTRIIEEVVSASVSAKNRQRFQGLCEILKTGDILVVTDIERLGRYRKNSLEVFKELINKGVIICILDLPYFNDWRLVQNPHLYNINTKLLIKKEEEIVRLQHQIKSNSTLFGMKKAESQGKKIGRPKMKLPPKDFIDNYKQYKYGALQGFNLRQFCDFCKISKSCYYKWVKLIEDNTPVME